MVSHLAALVSVVILLVKGFSWHIIIHRLEFSFLQLFLFFLFLSVLVLPHGNICCCSCITRFLISSFVGFIIMYLFVSSLPGKLHNPQHPIQDRLPGYLQYL